ncbi:MAG: hypothetical protein ACOY93_10075 [Bacillota bacterium]
MLSPFFYCGWWTAKTGQVLPGCLGRWWLFGTLRPAGPWWWWDRPGVSGPVTARRPQPAGVKPAAPRPRGLAAPRWAGLGEFRAQPQPGAQYAAPIGPAGPLGARWAQQAGPGVPAPYIRGPGVPGVPITGVSIGAPGTPITGAAPGGPGEEIGL